jgi:hypothetical protein
MGRKKRKPERKDGPENKEKKRKEKESWLLTF